MALPTVETGIIEEHRASLATTISSVFSIIRMIVLTIVNFAQKLVEWIGEHPLALALFITNVSVWIS